MGFQSRDEWSLNNHDAIEIKSKESYASSVTIPYVQNLTSKLKLRSALFSWLVWVVFLAMRKVTALLGGFPLQTWWLCKPRKELPSVPKVSSLPPISHHWEESLTSFPLIIGSKNYLSKDNCCLLSWVWFFSLDSNHVKKLHNALGWIIEHYLLNYLHVWFVYWLDQFLAYCTYGCGIPHQ